MILSLATGKRLSISFYLFICLIITYNVCEDGYMGAHMEIGGQLWEVLSLSPPLHGFQG